jgi:prenyltransferase beta subunit
MEMQELLLLAVNGMTKDALRGIRRFLRSQVRFDGGFKNRSGESDLYYGVFGGACRQAVKPGPLPGFAARYLRQFGTGEDLDFVHLVCLARSLSAVPKAATPGRLDGVLSRIEEYRSQDGGYSHTKRNNSEGSPYAAFLALLAYEDAHKALPAGDGILNSLEKSKACDGAYSNEPGMKEGSTAATAAAVIVRTQLGNATDPRLSEWILSRQSRHGGLLASPSAPAPDLLSTAVALFALRRSTVSLSPLLDKTTDFIEMLWTENGGFSGHLLDNVADCEYTFYALLALGCLETE